MEEAEISSHRHLNEAVYVEIQGESVGQGVGAFARDYDATIEVRELRVN